MRRDVLLARLGDALGPEWLPPQPRRVRVTTATIYEGAHVFVHGVEARAVECDGEPLMDCTFIDELADIDAHVFEAISFTKRGDAWTAP